MKSTLQPQSGVCSKADRSFQRYPTAEDGTKIVVFGGLLDFKVVGSDTWVLDVPTLTWTQGPDSKVKRCMNSCTIVGDTFISWGGNNKGMLRDTCFSVLLADDA